MTAAAAGGPYVIALRAKDLFADPTYQRDVDLRRVRAMAAEFDPRMLGVIDVSSRDGYRFAILDGQHRHALVTEVLGMDAPIVCQVYEGLSVDDEARLFHEINVRRKALNFWDRWKARRASGDERVALIEQVLAGHGLRVHPTAVDGNISATSALEQIVDVIGDHRLLDAVADILVAAFGRSREAFNAPVMQGLAHVLVNYPPAELDRDRLVAQLSELPARQIRARAGGMREISSGTLPRLCGAVIVEQYNRGPGRRIEPFLTRVPPEAAAGMANRRRRWIERHSPSSSAGGEPNPVASPPAEAPTPAGRSGQPDKNEGDRAGLVGRDRYESPSSPPAAHHALTSTSAATPVLCGCGHSSRLHDEGGGFCLAGCSCPGYQVAVA